MIILYHLLLLKDHVELMVAVAIVLPLWVVVRSSFATSPTKTYLVVMELEQDSPDSSSHSRRLWRGCYFYNRWHLLQMQRADLSTPLVGSCTAHAPALQKEEQGYCFRLRLQGALSILKTSPFGGHATPTALLIWINTLTFTWPFSG